MHKKKRMFNTPSPLSCYPPMCRSCPTLLLQPPGQGLKTVQLEKYSLPEGRHCASYRRCNHHRSEPRSLSHPRSRCGLPWYPPPQNDFSYKQEIKSKNNMPVSNYRRYSFIIIRKQCGGKKITDVTDVTVVTDLIKKWHWQDHGRLFEVHMSKHSPIRLKIMVGC